MVKTYVSIDIGGTWLKAVAVRLEEPFTVQQIIDKVKEAKPCRVRSGLGVGAPIEGFVAALDELCRSLGVDNDSVEGIGISTAGIVAYDGSRVLVASKHLCPIFDTAWIDHLKKRFNAPVMIANDADAAAIGAASLGYLQGNRTIAVMPVGTGVGYIVWRNGRKWTPHFGYTLFGAIETPQGSYDAVMSASGLAAKDRDHNLLDIFSDKEHEAVLEEYLARLHEGIVTSNIIYHTDKVLLGGGLAEAVRETGYPLAERLNGRFKQEPSLWGDIIEVKVMKEGNMLPLLGGALVAAGESKANAARVRRRYTDMVTEVPYDAALQLQKMSPAELAALMWGVEQQAGDRLKDSLGVISEVAENIVKSLAKGGRLIYVGCGTSGRLAAIDAVEIGCTFGFPRDRVITLISGGVADASIDIEAKFEEDASAVPEMLLANVAPQDVVVGISVSGTAYYVQSALGYAKYLGAYTVIIQEEQGESTPFCDRVISLRTGNEVVAGSTRMKAGTATKKVLNFLSTIAMVRLGRVYGSYMTELECINEKLVKRATSLLNILFGIEEEESTRLLKQHGNRLNEVIKHLEK